MMAARTYFTPIPSEPYFTVDMHMRQANRDKLHCLRIDDELAIRLYHQLDKSLKSFHGIPAGYLLHVIRPSRLLPLLRTLFPDMTRLGLYNAGYWDYYLNSGSQVNKFETITIGMDSENPAAMVENEPVLVSAADPISAEMFNGADFQTAKHPVVLDLTFSYPFIPESVTGWDVLFFQVNGAMGIPFPLLVVYIDPAGISDFYIDKVSRDISAMELYVLRMVTEDYLSKGMELHKRELHYKKAVMKNALETSSSVGSVETSNPTPTCFHIHSAGPIRDVITRLEAKGMVPGKGSDYSLPGKMIISNYPTHSKEQVEMLADIIAQI